MTDSVLTEQTALTLEISGQKVTPEKFVRGIRAFFGVLQDVTKDICVGRPPVPWLVQVSSGSNLVGVRPSPGYPYPEIIGMVADAVLTGIEVLEATPEEPNHFRPSTIRHVSDLARIVGRDELDDTHVRVFRNGRRVPVTHSSAANVATLLRTSVETYGSVEGRLQIASDRGQLHVVVYEPLWDKPIRCLIADEMLPEALSHFRRRVALYGMIRYRRDGQPASISVDEIVPFPERHELPSPDELNGILKEFS